MEMGDLQNSEQGRSTLLMQPGQATSQPTPGVQNESGGGKAIRQRELDCFDVSCLIINKIIGTGILVSPAIVVLLAGNKWAALLLWMFGSCYSFTRYLIIP